MSVEQKSIRLANQEVENEARDQEDDQPTLAEQEGNSATTESNESKKDDVSTMEWLRQTPRSAKIALAGLAAVAAYGLGTMQGESGETGGINEENTQPVEAEPDAEATESIGSNEEPSDAETPSDTILQETLPEEEAQVILDSWEEDRSSLNSYWDSDTANQERVHDYHTNVLTKFEERLEEVKNASSAETARSMEESEIRYMAGISFLLENDGEIIYVENPIAIGSRIIGDGIGGDPTEWQFEAEEQDIQGFMLIYRDQFGDFQTMDFASGKNRRPDDDNTEIAGVFFSHDYDRPQIKVGQYNWGSLQDNDDEIVINSKHDIRKITVPAHADSFDSMEAALEKYGAYESNYPVYTEPGAEVDETLYHKMWELTNNINKW